MTKTGRTNPGGGVLNLDQQAEVLVLLRGGMSRQMVAEHFGVTKNVIGGTWARYGARATLPVAKTHSTLFDRCDALNAAMDRVLTETKLVPRLPALVRVR